MNCQFFAAEANGDITISVFDNNLNVDIHNFAISTANVSGIAIICLDKHITPTEAAKDLAHKLSVELGLRFTFGEIAYDNFNSREERI